MKIAGRHYRADIDGLRAVAVVAVVLFHAFPEFVVSGFVGVDIFFVISGFLISRIIFVEIAEGKFSLARFYGRRVRRLFPALLAVLTTVLVASWLILLPRDLIGLGKQTAAGATFVANIYFWLQSGYFSPDARTVPLLHLWSLGVEEQFYIFWPLIVVFLRKESAWIAAILALGAASFFLSVGFAEHRSFDFYSLVTRAWELMTGAVLAWLSLWPHCPKVGTKASRTLVLLGLGLIAVSCFAFAPDVDYPSWRALVPVLGAAIVIAGGSTSDSKNILGYRPLTYTGLVSYPFYLWHWPVLVLATNFKLAGLTLLERGLLVFICYALAALTYEFIEKPFREAPLSGRKVVGLCAGMSVLAAFGLVLVAGNGFAWRFPKEIQEATKGEGYPSDWRTRACLLDLSLGDNKFKGECTETSRPMIAVWGDSTAAALMPGLRLLQSKHSFGLTQYTASSCAPILDSPTVTPTCKANNETVVKLLAGIRPDTVLLHGSGPLNAETMISWRKSISSLMDLGINRIIVLGPVPVWKRTLPGQTLNYYIKYRKLLPLRTNEAVFNLWDDSLAHSFFNGLGIEYISAWHELCTIDGCLTRVHENGPLTALDVQHLTEQGSQLLLSKIETKLLDQ